MGGLLNGFFEFIAAFIIGLIFIIFMLAGVIFFGKGESEYRAIVINELCQKQQYDFCEVKETVYKYKEQSDE